MNRSARRPRPERDIYSQARPAGESDSEHHSDEELFDFHGFASRRGNGTADLPNGNVVPPSAVEDWENDTDTPAVPLAPTEEEIWGATSAAIIRTACIRGNLDKLREQLSRTPNFNINEFFMDTEETPLITACLHGRFEIVEYLLDVKAADPNLRHQFEKQTPLIVLAGGWTEEMNYEDLIKCASKLVQAKADLNRQDRFGLSALMIAVKRRRLSLVEYLLKAGADPNLTDRDGRTALFFAVLDGDGRMCRRLLEHGADVTIEDHQGWCVPELAQDHNFTQIANLLFLVRETQWRPGLHPKLMLELDEETALKRKNEADLGAVRDDSAVEMMLQAVDGEKYLVNFRKHKISYVHLLTLNEDQLKEIGVDQVGVRERLLDLIKKTHNVTWDPASIRSIATNKNVTAAEAVCMVVNIRDHLNNIAGSLTYLNQRIQQEPRTLQYDVERNRIEDLINFCRDTELKAMQVCEKLKGVQTTIEDLIGYTELQPKGRLPKKSFRDEKMKKVKRERNWRLTEMIVGGVGIGMLCYFMGRKYLNRL